MDLGKDTMVPVVRNKIQFHLVYNVDHGEYHNSRLVYDVHLTDISVELFKSRVVSLSVNLLVLILSKLNEMETLAADIGNTYIGTKILENFYIIAGYEFGDREGQTIIFYKTLCSFYRLAFNYMKVLMVV